MSLKCIYELKKFNKLEPARSEFPPWEITAVDLRISKGLNSIEEWRKERQLRMRHFALVSCGFPTPKLLGDQPPKI